ncbi:hypothetical protein [Streptomyces sp. SID685]|uniref:hypothetical protein n=1 Tax=Streptomyces sp. SID685 TaxID=2690322 RepID=UPI0031FEC9D0
MGDLLVGADGDRGSKGGFPGAGVTGVARMRAWGDLDAGAVTGCEPVEGRPQRHF